MTDREKQIEEMATIINTTDCSSESFDYLINSLSEKKSFKGIDTQKFIDRKKATALYNAGYRKMDELTLKLDLGDRSAEEIQQIAEAFNQEIKKQVAKEIIDSLLSECDSSPYDCVEPNHILYLAKKYGVEIDE